MLNKILKQLKPAFARSIKPKLPKPIPIVTTTSNNPKQINEEIIPQQPIINKKLKEHDEQLKSKVKKLMEEGLKEEEIISKFIPPKQIKVQENDDQTFDLLKQDLIINQIMKKHKDSKKQLRIGSKYQQQKINEQELSMKQQRIYNKIRKETGIQNPLKQLNFEEQIKSKYSSQLIERAQKQKEVELAYFKELMGDITHKQYQNYSKVHFTKRRLKKNETYAEMLERDRVQKENERIEKKMLVEQKKFLNELKQQEKEARRPNTSQIVQFENQEYYKQKAMKQFETRQKGRNKQDEQLIKAGQEDMDKSSDLYDIMIDQYQDIEYGIDQKKQLYEASTFGKFDAKLLDIENRLRKHGIDVDLEQLDGMKKQMLFRQKKLREEQLQYEKYLMRKEKKKKMKQYYQKIHAQKLRQDLDYENDIKNRFKDFKYDPLDIEANIQKIKEINMERQATILAKDKHSEIHFKKTEKNIENFILAYFYRDLCNPNQNLYQKISIKEIKYNEKKTLVHIFWAFEPQANKHPSQDQINNMQKKLFQSSNFISGKMTQLLDLRYGPEIRFIYDKILDQTNEIKRSLENVKDQVVDFEIRNLIKKGHIKTPQQVKETKKKLEAVANQNIKNYHNRNKLLSKKYRKKQRQENLQSVKRKKSAKKSSQQKLWQHIDKL